jgi:hypothetical protein
MIWKYSFGLIYRYCIHSPTYNCHDCRSNLVLRLRDTGASDLGVEHTSGLMIPWASRTHLVLLSTLILLTAIVHLTLVLQASLSVSLNFLHWPHQFTPSSPTVSTRLPPTVPQFFLQRLLATTDLSQTVIPFSVQRLLFTTLHHRSLSLTVMPFPLLRSLSTTVHLRSRSPSLSYCV